jgi:hypothetical protein
MVYPKSKNRKMKYTKFPLLMLCALATLAGCVKEKLTDCYTTFVFSYTGDTRAESIFAEKIEHIDVYVYDDSDRLVMQFEPSAAELAAQRARVLLPTGQTYHAVAIANMQTCVLHNLEIGSVFDSRIMHPASHPEIDTGDQHVDTHDHLYGDNQMLVIPPLAGSTHTFDFRSGHVDMVVEVVGYEEYAATRQGSPELELEHRGLPVWTDFGRGISPETEHISHHPEVTRIEGGANIHEYAVMRHLDGSTIHLHSGGEEIFTLDVEEFIQSHLQPDPDFAGPYGDDGELLHEALIPIRIEFKAVGIEVTIPTWAIKDVTPEF